MASQPYQDGETRNVNGVPYVRQGGRWVPQGGGSAAPTLTPITGPRQPAPRHPDEAQLGENRAAASEQDPRIAEANARKAEADARAAEIQLQQGGGTPAERQQLATRRANMEAASQQLLRLGELYRGGYEGGYSPFESLPDFASPSNAQFNSAAAGLSESAFASLRVPGVGSQSDAELRQFLRANEPSAQSFDSTIEERLDTVQRRLNAQREEMGLPPIDWRNPPQPATPPPGAEPQGVPQAAGPAGGEPPQGGQQPPPGMDRSAQLYATSQGPEGVQLNRGETRLEEDPVLRGVSRRIGQMMVQGVSDGQILDYIRRAGVDPAQTNIQQALNYRRTRDFQSWKRANPNAPYPIGPSFYTRDVPQTDARRFIGALSNSPLGAYAVNAGDSVTFGTLDNMTDNPAQARAGMQALRGEHPVSSTVGSLSGAALNIGGTEIALARLGLRGLAGARTADATFGAGYGAGSADEGNRLLGAAGGTAFGLAGGEAGRRVANTAGRTLTGTRDAATRYLTDRGIPVTLGQVAGRGGVLGRTVRGLEDKLESLPLIGEVIRTRRAEGYREFNRAAFDEALQSIEGTTGGRIAEEGVEAGRSAVGQAYDDALGSVRVEPDDDFITEMGAVLERGERLPGAMGENFRFLMQEHVSPALEGGFLTGQGYQAVRQTLRQERSSLRGELRARDYAKSIREVEGVLERLVRRQAPDVVPDLNAADAAHSRLRVIENAVERGKNTGGVFTPAQLGTSAAAGARRFGGKQATTERPFFELQRNAQDVLPSTVPNSGTVDRAAAVALLPAAASGTAAGLDWISPEQAGILGALGLPFTRTGVATLQKLMVSRPEIVRRAGERVIAAQRLTGRAGSAAVTLAPLPGQ